MSRIERDGVLEQRRQMSLVLSLSYQSLVLGRKEETLARARAFGKWPPSSASQAAKQAGQAAV